MKRQKSYTPLCSAEPFSGGQGFEEKISNTCHFHPVNLLRRKKSKYFSNVAGKNIIFFS